MTPNLQEELIGVAKSLLRIPKSGALATLKSGAPFASLVTFASDFDGSPIFLLSTLAVHRQNLDKDPRCSFLISQTGKGDPLAHPRLTVSGTAEPDRTAHLRSRFLARQPKAALYADFADFAIYRLHVTDFHLNGGYGRAADIDAPEILTKVSNAEDFAAQEPAALEFLNTHHIDLLRQATIRQTGSAIQNWRAIGLDPEGIDLAGGERTARLNLSLPVIDNATLSKRLKAL